MTILFHRDWKNDRGELRAIPHATTKNESFLRTCALLKKMGIKNYAFPLALYDPDLKDVDPHDLEEDTPENEILRLKVMKEARINGWYYLREVARVYSQGGDTVPFRLDRGSCAMAWCFFAGLDYATMQPRQAQPLDAFIRTPTGYIPMGDVSLGTTVLAPDGTPIKVVGVYPLGVKEVFRVTLKDGSNTRCCKDHLWRVYFGDTLNSKFGILSLEEIINLANDCRIPVYNPDGSWKLEQIESVTSVGYTEVQCISVDHKDQLYITDDDIISHNTGKTVTALSLTAWIIYTSGYSYTLGHMAKDNSLRRENVKRVKEFGEALPAWWIASDRNKDRSNTEELYYHELQTHYTTFVANADPRKADIQARGASNPFFHFDELEFIVNIGISFPTILASTTTARENAKRNGKPHSIIITTTAGDPTKPECKEAINILDGAMPFTEHLYDIENSEKLHEIVKAASPQKMVLGVFSHLQLGFSNEWLRDIILRNRMTKEQVMRDYLNRRVSIQDAPVIPAGTLATINASQEEPKWIEILNDKFVIYWYVEESVVKSQAFRDRPIVLGCDSSEMIDRDATTLVGVDPRDLSVVCTFRTTEGNINTVAVMIAHLLLRYPKFLFVPENKSSGTSIIDIVALFLKDNGHNPFTRIFNWIVNNRHEEEFGKYNIRDTSLINTAAKKYFGIKTDKTKRDELYSSVLLIGVSKAASRIKDKTLIRELCSLTVRNGRVDHESGGNDDTTIAFLMAIYVILNGKHLDVYGIKPNTIMSYINPGQPDKSVLTAEKQQLLRNKIEEMEAQYKAQTDPSLCRLLQSDIKVLKSMLDKSHVPITDVSDDLYRDPKRFTDPVVSEQSKPSVSAKDLESSMRLLLGLS